MAIEDEIINISDIDVGTEILNNDKLIVETNNGTKLLAFKDLVIGEDNITFKDKLVQGVDPTTGASSTTTDTVTGFNILTDATTSGHISKYTDISGTVELGRFNYEGVSKFASLSSTIEANSSAISDLQANLTTIHEKLANSSSADLSAITITTKSTNFKLTNTGTVNTGVYGVGFDTKDLDPVTTNDAVDFEISPFKITYPNDSSFSDCWILFMADCTRILASGASSGTHGRLMLYVNGSIVAEEDWRGGGKYSRGSAGAKLQTFHYIKKGDVVTLTSNPKARLRKGSNFAGVKIS